VAGYITFLSIAECGEDIHVVVTKFHALYALYPARYLTESTRIRAKHDCSILGFVIF
jgi:hypothetical protein